MVGTVALPKSVNATRLAENIAIFDFELSADDIAAIDKLDNDFHFLRPNDWYQARFRTKLSLSCLQSSPHSFVTFFLYLWTVSPI